VNLGLRAEAQAEALLHLAVPPSDGFLRSQLTALVFTSPVASNPSLEMILAVIESFRFIPGLAECRLLITCDGAGKVCDEVRPKRGLVTAGLKARYDAFVERLRIAFGSHCILALPEREGFGRAVRAALALVETPYVLICQHDNLFVRPVDLQSVVRVMEANREELKCVHLVSPKTTFEEKEDGGASFRRVEDRLGRLAGGARRFAAPADGEPGTSMTFWPMPSWLERNHVCSTEHYRDFVLGPGTRLKPGQFIEETFGQHMRRDLAAGGSHAKYGIYRLIDVPEPATLHLDGRSYLPLEEKRRKGWQVSDLFVRLAQQQRIWLAQPGDTRTGNDNNTGADGVAAGTHPDVDD